jgi:large subunit ribosomal protein L20
MAHVKRGVVSKRKHKKILKLAKGYWGTRSRVIRRAKESVLHSGEYAFQGRRNKKRDFRTLWNIRISEALKKEGLSYSKFMGMLKKSKIELDRKILSNLVVEDAATFKEIVAQVKKA